MSCYKSADASSHPGFTGKHFLVIKIQVPSGVIAPELVVGKLPNNPKHVFPVVIKHAVPGGATTASLELTHEMESEKEFTEVEIFCNSQDNPGTKIAVEKNESVVG